MRTLTLFLFLAVLLLPACGEGPTEPVGPPLGQPFSLRVGESTPIRSESVRIGFEQLREDSRCPIDAICVWEGEAVVALWLERRGRAIPFQLSTREPQTTISGYIIRLRTVLPARQSNVQPDPRSYSVELIVTK